MGQLPSLVLRLYVTEGAKSSVAALLNIRRICDTYLPGGYRLEVIDLLEQPERLLADGILVTPTLVRVHPEPAVQLTGPFEETEAVLALLGLNQRTETAD